MPPHSSSSCPLVGTFHFISKRWMILVLRATHDGKTQFCEIKRAIPGISSRLLSERLRELAEAGFIERECPADCQTPRYRLARKGRTFIDCLITLDAWAEEHAFAGEAAPDAPR